MTVSRNVEYSDGTNTYEGFLLSSNSGPNPGVLLCHAWAGLGDYEKEQAEKVAAWGYSVFCADVYGKGKRGTTVEENQALMGPLVGDRPELQKRLAASLDAMKAQSEVDGSKMAAIGFCFGGLCVLDMARMGAEVSAVGSFHGLFMPADNITKPKISAKVAAYHGWADPMVPPDMVTAFAEEMTGAGANWQLHGYGSVGHAFTNKEAADPENGMAFDADANRRSYSALKELLAEVF